ncbi:hypothetical protein B0H63DRAFT_458530 [Podospora didyma]|uniref:Uncharacterized protein n=1 Tax=Podospora didyma TaxID=330526 RepID=A0AAE0U7R8_9PEZI|nr:hypothetical protein B0H63DRAFT_458530 [Podospora didyma]
MAPALPLVCAIPFYSTPSLGRSPASLRPQRSCTSGGSGWGSPCHVQLHGRQPTSCLQPSKTDSQPARLQEPQHRAGHCMRRPDAFGERVYACLHVCNARPQRVNIPPLKKTAPCLPGSTFLHDVTTHLQSVSAASSDWAMALPKRGDIWRSRRQLPLVPPAQIR